MLYYPASARTEHNSPQGGQALWRTAEVWCHLAPALYSKIPERFSRLSSPLRAARSNPPSVGHPLLTLPAMQLTRPLLILVVLCVMSDRIKGLNIYCVPALRKVCALAKNNKSASTLIKHALRTHVHYNLYYDTTYVPRQRPALKSTDATAAAAPSTNAPWWGLCDHHITNNWWSLEIDHWWSPPGEDCTCTNHTVHFVSWLCVNILSF